jgi:hypothetical protein
MAAHSQPGLNNLIDVLLEVPTLGHDLNVLNCAREIMETPKRILFSFNEKSAHSWISPPRNQRPTTPDYDTPVNATEPHLQPMPLVSMRRVK